MTKAPKCKLCGVAHWLDEAHTYAVEPQAVSNAVRNVFDYSVTNNVTEAAMITAAVTSGHECPICGLLHHRPSSNADRQRAYRERKRGN